MQTVDLSPAMDTNMSGARAALLRSFGQLVLSRRYGDFGVNCVIRSARVARSTFYYHFSGKDDLLLENLRPFVETLTSMTEDAKVSPELERWVTHIWEHRGTARRLLSGRTGEKIETMLTNGFREKLLTSPLQSGADAQILAEQMAGATLGLLRGWVGHRFSVSQQALAQALWHGVTALAHHDGAG